MVDQEGLLATSFECEWKELYEDPKKAGTLVPKPGGVSDKESVPHDIPPYPDT